MATSPFITSVQADKKIQDSYTNLEQKIIDIRSGIKDTATQSNAPTPYDAVTYPDGLFETYVVREPLTMPNSWGYAVTQAELDVNYVYFDVRNGNITKRIQPIKTLYDDYLASTTDNPKLTQLEFVESYKPFQSNDDSNLFVFNDSEDASIGLVNNKGEFDILLTEKTKNEARLIDDIDALHIFTDSQKNIVSAINSDGVFEGKIKVKKEVENIEGFFVAGLEVIKNKLSLKSIAVGRASAEGVDDATKVTLDGDGYTHPKVLYFENGFAGFKFWMAITPTFGLINDQVAPAFFENPHIFCSQDGENWIEPVGINNPIDVTAPLSFTEAGYPFWSDTHLLLGNDGYLYCYYRGVGMPKGYLVEGETGLYDTVTVCKKSRDGINWGEREIVFEHPNGGSQAFVKFNNTVHCFDVVFNSVETPLPVANVPNWSAVFRRSSLYPNKEFNEYENSQIINFKNNYLPTNNAIWHLEVEFFEGIWLMLINSGVIGHSTGADVYLAYSYDGWNFEMIKEPIFYRGTYRSCLTPIKYENGVMEIYLYRARTTDGGTDLYKLILKK